MRFAGKPIVVRNVTAWRGVTLHKTGLAIAAAADQLKSSTEELAEQFKKLAESTSITFAEYVRRTKVAEAEAEERERVRQANLAYPGETPDVLGEIFGYRLWYCDVRTGALFSINRDVLWQPHRPASCKMISANGRPPQHQVTFPGCGCGYWALDSLAHLLDTFAVSNWTDLGLSRYYDWGYGFRDVQWDYFVESFTYCTTDEEEAALLGTPDGGPPVNIDDPVLVIGKVAGSGLVCKHEIGFRAETMRVEEVYVPTVGGSRRTDLAVRITEIYVGRAEIISPTTPSED
jgi:hypothetical protein